MKRDPDEKYPIGEESSDAEATAARRKLQAVLDKVDRGDRL
jgi:hypothetical protein